MELEGQVALESIRDLISAAAKRIVRNALQLTALFASRSPSSYNLPRP